MELDLHDPLLTKEELKPLLEHPDPEIRELANNWLDLYQNLIETIKQKRNHLSLLRLVRTQESQLRDLIESLQESETPFN